MRPQEFAVTMGTDAFRIAIGIKPRTHKLDEIVRWLTLMTLSQPAPTQEDKP